MALKVVLVLKRLKAKTAQQKRNATMTIAYACVLFMGLLPYIAAGIAKKGFEHYDNSMPRQWLANQTGFRARANAAQANLFESLPFFFAAVSIAHIEHGPQAIVDFFAVAFVIARITYLICYIANWSTTRSIVWLLGLVCVIAIFCQI